MNKLPTFAALPVIAGAILIGGAIAGYAGLAAAQDATTTIASVQSTQTPHSLK